MKRKKLSYKIFFIVFSIMLVIEGMHMYMDVQTSIENDINLLWTETGRTVIDVFKVMDISQEYKEVNDPAFLKEVQEQTRTLGNYNTMILNRQCEEVDDGAYWETDNRYFTTLELSSGTDYIHAIELRDLDRSVYNKLVDKLLEMMKSSQEKIKIKVDDSILKTDEYCVLAKDIQYLEVDGEVFIDTQQYSQVLDLEVTLLESNKFYMVYQPDKNQYSGWNHCQDDEEFLKVIRNKVNNKEPDPNKGLLVSYGGDYVIINGNIYVFMKRWLNNGGYIVSYTVHYNAINELRNSIIQSKTPLYILVFILSVSGSALISYLITKRVDKMNKATKLIADNHFDIQLEEKPYDELGELSSSINKMSRDLKETMDQLNQEIERVKELESLRKDFINQFTHEMKTPLGIINGYSELLDEADSDEEKEKYLEIINHETSRINQLILSMLNLSRLEAGKVELNKEDIDLEDLMTDIVDEYEVLLMKKNIQVEMNAIDTIIHADQNLIKTVLHNFLSNAIKHVNENGKIIITFNHGISVFNEGKLIEKDRLESIWYTFVTHDKEGSGLGLAICRSILELHGFDYGVKNKDNGVEFYFYQ